MSREGIAPSLAVSKTAVLSLTPAGQEMAPSLGVAPSSNCLTGRLHTPCIRRSEMKWSEWQDSHLRRLAPKARAWLLGYIPVKLVFLPRVALGTHPSRGWMISPSPQEPESDWRMKVVDRHGFAPCSPACKADDLLNDRAAQEIGSGGRTRTGVWAAYETAALPLGDPAV